MHGRVRIGVSRINWLLVSLFFLLHFSLVEAQTFTEVPTSLPGLYVPSIEWGDYDSDGDLDLLLTGNGMAKVFRNDGNAVFTEIANLASISYGDGTWGDYDNDGDLDILITGNSPTKIFSNDGIGTFTDIGLNILTNDSWGDVDWGDFDNDGDLDILLNGHHSYYGWLTRVYEYKNGQYSLKYDFGYNYMGDVNWGDYDNDGDLDILTSGDNSRIFQNNGPAGISTIRNFGAYYDCSSATWGDYDNDGDLDVLLLGYSGVLLSRNDGNNLFTDISTSLPNVRYGYADFGDFDNDGDLDILLTGYKPGEVSEIISRIYRNNGNNVFTDIQAGLTGIHYSCGKFGDYDNDGDLDVILSGHTGTSEITKLYRNDGIVSNTAPLAPNNLSETITDSYVQFSWDKSSDAETPQAGLTYNLRIGTASESGDDFSPASASDGLRQIVRMGNTNLNKTWKINNLQPGEHFWSVQTVDNAYKGSPFATERSFIFTASSHYVPVSPDPFIFKAIQPGETKMQKLQIINPLKSDILHITDIILDNPVFSLNQTAFDIDPADTVELVITFAPSSIGVYNDTLKLTISNPYIPVQKYNVTAYAANTLCGVLTQNTTWTKANSPYFINCGNLGVDQGVTLTIEAGVTVVLDSMKRILVDGELIVKGTEDEPVLFTNNGSNRFERIYFRANSKGQLNNFSIENAQQGIFAENAVIIADKGKISKCNLGISLNGTKAIINNTEIFENTTNGIYAENTSILNLNYSIIRDNKATGLNANSYCNINTTSSIFKNNSGDGFCFTNYSTAVINKSLVENNQGNGISYPSSWEWVNLTAKGNIIRENNGWAIYSNCENQTTIIESNFIQQNGSGLFFRNGTIKSNTISDNRGVGIKAVTSSAISYNKVYNNFSDGIVANGNCNINNNLILSNKGNGIVDNGNSQIRYNEIINNTLNGVLANNISTINYNSVFNNRKYDIEVTKQTSETVNAEYNWWGTTVVDTIKNHVRDFYDDAASVKVDFNPFKGAPVPLESVKGFIAVKDMPGKIKISWQENIKAKNYLLYYDNQSGTIDTTSVWVTLDSLATSYTATLAVGDYKFAIRALGESGGVSQLVYYNYVLSSISEFVPEFIDFGSLRPSKYIDSELITHIKNTGDLSLHVDSIGGITPPFSIGATFPADISSGDSIPVMIKLERNYPLNTYALDARLYSNGSKLQSDTILKISAVIKGISAPANFKASYFKDSLKLTWNAVNESDLAGYKIYRNNAADPSSAMTLANLTNTDTSFSDNTIIPGLTYYYWVTAIDTADYESELSLQLQTISPPKIPNSGLIAFYPFNGNANDESNNGHIASVSGATLVSDRFGKPNSAYTFDGINDKIETDFHLGGYSTFSISVWVKPISFGSGLNRDMIISQDRDWCNGEPFYISFHRDRKFSASITEYCDNSKVITSGTNTVNFENWYHIVYTFDGSQSSLNCKLYINGFLADTASLKGNIYNYVNYNLVFGGKRGSENFNGLLDDIAIYSRVLNLTEITNIYGKPVSPTELNFGALAAGSNKTLKLKILNSESSDADYTINTLNVPFTVGQSSINIQANGSGTINLSFNPSALGFYTDTLYIERTDHSKPLIKVPVSGSSVTQLCGVITEDTTLTKAKSPYFINCVLTIDKGKTLAIEPGVTIQIDSMRKILVDGSLIANGTPEEPIRFISEGGDNFDRIFFRQSGASLLSNVIIEGAQKGIYGENTSLTITGGEITSCGQGIELNNCRANISDILISGNLNNGIYSYNGTTGSISNSNINNNIENGVLQGAFTMTGNTITNNRGWGIYIDENQGKAIDNCILNNNGSGLHASNSLINRNIVSSNTDQGINATGATIGENIISSNKGIGINAWSSRVQDNTINNNLGWGIRAVSSTLTNNKVRDNSLGGISGESLTLLLNFINHNAGNGLSLSASTIKQNEILQNAGNGISTSGYNIIENNKIAYNTGDGINEGSNCTIKFNDIYANGGDGIETATLPVINFNNIIGNKAFDLKATKQSNETVNAENNYWGTTSSSVIKQRVYDYYDDGATVKVDYDPYKNEPITLNVVQGFTANKISNGIIELNWTPVMKSSGYQLFYDNQSGIVDSLNIWVSLDSSKTSYQASLPKADFKFAIKALGANNNSSKLSYTQFKLSAILDLAPVLVDFGTLRPSKYSKPQLSAWIRNVGDKPLYIDSLAVIDHPYKYAYEVPDTIIDGDSAIIVFTLDRNSVQGSYKDNLNIFCNASNKVNTLNEGLVAYYPFQGNALDESGYGRNGNVSGAFLGNDRFGNPNSAYSFDGIDDYIKSFSNNLPTGERTISLWFNANKVSNMPGLIGYGGSSSCNSYLQIINSGQNGKFEVQSHCGANSLMHTYSQIPVNTWHHWLITTSQAGTVMYIDGAEVSRNSNFINNTFVTDRELSIGSAVSPYGSAPYTDASVGYFSGSLDEIRIYNRSISESEIQALYYSEASSISLIAKFDYIDPPSNFKANYYCDSMQFTWNASSEADLAGYKLYRNNSDDTSSLVPLFNLGKNVTAFTDHSFIPGQNYSYWISAIDTAGFESNLSNSVKTTANGLPTDGLLAWYPYNSNANDESGNNNNCTVSSATLAPDRFGVANNAFSFTGSSKIFSSISNVPQGNTPRSICFWTKPNSDGGTIINMGKNECSYKMFSIGRSGATAYFWGGCYDFPLGFTIPNNEWSHIALTYEGGNMVIFKNGSLVNTLQSVPFSTFFSDFIIGAFGNNANDTWNYYNGLIDDIALYNRALTPEEVTLLYQGTQHQKVNFSVVETNSSITKTFNLSNTANIPKSFKLYAPTAPYAIEQSSITVDASGNVPVNVTFHPTVLGVYRDTILVEAESHDEPIRVVALSGLSVTPVCGVYSEDFTLTKEYSPYYINCNMGVDSGATLTIEPGVMLILDSMRQVTIDGRLVANGTESEPILFTNAAFDPFGNIFFRSGSGEFSHFQIENADKGIWGDVSEVTLSRGKISNCRNAVEMNGGKLIIDSMTFIDNRENGVFANNNVTGNITNSLFTGNYYGVNSPGGNFTFENNILSENKSWAVILSSNSNKPVRNNIVTNNGAGMSVNTANLIENNIIELNKGEGLNAWNSFVSGNKVLRNSGRGMYANNCSVRDNVIEYNFSSGLFSDGGSIVERNSIRYNTGDGVIGGNITLSSNYIENNSGIGVSLTNSAISDNKIMKNGSIGIQSDNNTITSNLVASNGNDGIRENGNSQIMYNDIFDNMDDGIEAANLPVINFNNIYNNKKFNVKALRKSYETINAKENYWGTTLTSKISSKIWDYYDDGVTVKVTYSNWANEAILMRPVDNFRARTLEGGKVELVWNNHPKAYQYYLFYSNSDVAIDTTIAWVVLDSTKISYQTTLPDGEYLFGIKPVNYSLEQGIMATTDGTSDGTPPTLLSAYGETQDSTLLVTFSEEIDFFSAIDPAKWSLNNGLSVKKVYRAEDKDLIVGGNWGDLRVYLNNSIIKSIDLRVTNSMGIYNSGWLRPAFTDIDTDGDFDLFIGNDGNTVFFRNIGNALNPIWNQQSLKGFPLNCHQSFYPVDINNDSNVELINANNWCAASIISFSEELYQDQTLWKQSSFMGFCSGKASFTDIDNDKDFDLFIGDCGGNLYFYRNDGNSFEPKWSMVTSNYLTNLGTYSTPEFTDIDGDGDFDLFLGKENGSITYFRNDGTPEEALFSRVTDNFLDIYYYLSAPVFIDLDGDGSKQAVILQLDGPLPGTGTEISLSNTGMADNTGNIAGSQNITFYTDDGNKNPSVILGSIPGVVSKDVTVNYIISDAEKDIVKLKPSYSTDGGTTWHMASITGDTVNLDSTKYSGSVVWHSYADIPGVVLKNVRFRLTPRDGDLRYDGTPGVSNKLIVNNNIRPVVTIPLIVGEVKDDVTISYLINDNEADLCRIYAEYYNPVTKVWLGATITGDTTDIANGVHSIVWKAGIDLAGSARVTPFRITPYDADKGQSDTVDLVVDNIGISSVQITNMLPFETGGDVLFNYLVSDDEQDEIDLRAQYSTNKGLTWKTASVSGNLDSIVFADYAGSFTWNTNTDFNGIDVSDVLFRLTPNDGNDGIPAEWTFHIDNNGIPAVTLAEISGLKRGNIIISYNLTDPEGNSLRITMRYLKNNLWNPCTLEGKTTGILPANYSGSLVWNSLTDIPDADGTYTLIMIPADNDEGAIDTIDIEINNMSIINLGGSSAICQGQSHVYNAGWEYKSFLWSTGETSRSVELNTNGSYWVKAVDYNNKIHYSDTVTISVHPLPEPELGNDIFLCQGQQETLFAGTFNSYSWNTGYTGSTLAVGSTGNYTVTVTDEFGCQNSDTAYVFVQSPYEDEQICFVTANKQLNNNTIVWKRTPGKGTLLYKVYRESISGGYEMIGMQEYDDAGIFTDTLSFSDQLKYNYKLSLVDTCGHESGLSPAHGTIFLKVNKGSAGFDLTWTAYEGINLAKYEIYRGSDSINMVKVKDIAGSITSWSDNFVPQCVVYYKVKASIPSGCIDAGSPDYTGIESNIAGNGAVKPRPVIMGPVTFCDGESTMLDAGNFASYLWSNGKTTQSIEISTGGKFTVNVSNDFGCYATSDTFTISVTTSPQFNLGNDTTVCGNQLMTINGPAAFHSYLWENGSTQKDRSVSSTGLFRLTVTDKNGCQGSDEILVVYSNTPIITLNPIEYICGDEPAFLDPGEFVSYKWSNGSNSRIQKVATNQALEVTVYDVNSCSATKQVLVESRSSAKLDLGSDLTICQNDSVELSPRNSYISYLWSSGETTAKIVVHNAGNISLQATDIFKCRSTDTIAINTLPAPIAPNLGTTRTICYGDEIIIDAGSGYASYMWNNNMTTQSIAIDTSGIFSVTAYGVNGCGSKASLEVKATIPYSGQKICMVTVDESGKNMVIWEKPDMSSIEQYLIYRESTFAGVYEIIGVQSATQLTVFTDAASAPEEKSDRYRISVVDTCGNESPMSPPHKTMHLTINKGLNEELNLIWENYEGMLFGTYEIYRGPAADSLELLKTVQSSITSFTDNTVPEGIVYYQISLLNPDTCDPAGLLGKKASSGPFVHSLSNLEDNRIQGTNINNPLADAIQLTVYPSPFTDFTTISYSLEKPARMKVEIYNVVGEKIKIMLDENQSAGAYKLEMKATDVNYKPGLYYLRILVDDTVIMRKAMLTR